MQVQEAPADVTSVTAPPPVTVLNWRLWLLVALVVVLYAVVLKDLVAQWWTDGNYSHGFLVPVFAAYVGWSRREELRLIEARPNWAGLGVVMASIGVLYLGSLGAEFFLARISLLGVIIGLLLLIQGWQTVKALAFPLGVLVLMVPLPTILYNRIVFPLQLLASGLAATCVTSTQLVPVLREGNVLILPNARLEVVEACSGIRSLMTLITLAVAYGYLREQRIWIRIALVVAMVPVAVISNAARVSFTALISPWWGEASAEGPMHFSAGIVLFVSSILLMLAVHKLLLFAARLRTGAAQ